MTGRAHGRRWCKGNLQNTFSRDCTLFDRSQPIMLRILWNAVTWHYLTCSVYTPTFLLVPMLAILAGIFPIALNRVFALAFTVYFCMQQIVRAHLPASARCTAWTSHVLMASVALHDHGIRPAPKLWRVHAHGVAWPC